MKNVIIIGLSALLLFSLSASLSLWLNNPTSAEKKKPDDENAKVIPKKDPDPRLSEEAPSPRSKEPLTALSGIGAAPPSPEEAAQLLIRLRERNAALDRREAELKRREGQVRLIMEDLRSERAILDGLRKQVGEELKATSDKLVQLERRAGDIEERQKDLTKAQAEAKKAQITLDGIESKNFEKISPIIDSMAPESAALILKQMADSGKLETAVKILSLMKDRRAAAVLAEVNDPPLSSQLLEKMRGLRRPTPPGSE